MENNVVLTMRDISKTFPGVKALQHVDFTLRKGEIHALMGENGAGKSTLIKVLTGVHPFESGEIKMEGKDAPIVNRSPQDAQDNGISTVYQEVNLCPNLTVAENLFIGREPRKAGLIDWKTMNKKSTELLKDLQIDAKATDKLEECSLAKQQMIAIARAVDMNCRVLILDEPTSSLDDDEVEKLFVLMNRLKAQGVGIIFVTHFLEQVYAVCDRITVLRNGELVGEYTTKDLPRVMLVAKMMGKDFDDLADIKGEHAELKEFIPVIEAEGIGRKGSIRPFNFTVNKGEVVGLTGLLGSGRSELVRAIYGADKPDSGKIKVNGKEVKINSPLDAMKLGMAYLPEDRKKDGIIADLSVRENIIIALQAKRGMFHPLSKKEMEEAADKYIEMLQIKTASRETPIKSLSGGNQQKVIIGRWLLTNPDYLILDEPTSSLDDDEVEKLFVLMRRLRDEGVGIIFVTHFLEQVYAVCDRITVLRNGELVGEYETKDLPRVMLVAKMMGKDFDDLAAIKDSKSEEKHGDEDIVIKAVGLGKKGYIKPFDLVIHKGEVVGFTGLLGSGRSETVRVLYGAEKPDEGELSVKGRPIAARHPLTSMNAGMAYLPEDRKNEGIIADLSVRENLIMALQAKRGMFHLLSRKQQEEFTDKYIDMLQIKTASRETPIKSLSGGNQQKVIIGRWLLTNPDFLILDEPTRGIDVGTKTEIQKLVLDLADQGMAVTFISSEVEEMLRTCSRMGVLRDGKKVGEISGNELSQEGIMKAIAGGGDNE